MQSSWLNAACLAAVVGCAAGCQGSNKVAAATDNGSIAPPQAPQCGHAGLPDCPLQRWMKATLQIYLRAGDYQRLGSALAELAQHAPAGYPAWKTQALRGADAAGQSDADAIRQICKDCHQGSRARYRQERRTTPIW
jgi:hypothetical protein